MLHRSHIQLGRSHTHVPGVAVPKHTKYCATPPTPKLREEKVVTCFQEAINNTGIDSNEPRFTRLELPSISLQKEEWQYICQHTRCKRGVSSQGIPPQFNSDTAGGLRKRGKYRLSWHNAALLRSTL